MSNVTENYGLKKPLPEEFYDINVHNENMDKVDAELKNRVPQLATYYPANSGKNADDVIDPFALIPVSSEVNPELHAIIGGTFAWIWTSCYIQASVTNRRMQIAMSYNTVNQRMAFRTYGSAGWQPWEGLALTSKVPTKASDISAFPSSGGTLTGQMTIKKYDNGHARFNKNHSDTNDYGTTVTDYDKNGKSSTINVRASEDKAYFTDNNGKYHELYHKGNLPNATYVPVTSEVPSDSDIWIDPNDEPDIVTGTLITFVVANNEYQAEDCMTWLEWVNSEYNIHGFRCDGADSYVHPSEMATHLAIRQNEYIIVRGADEIIKDIGYTVTNNI